MIKKNYIVALSIAIVFIFFSCKTKNSNNYDNTVNYYISETNVKGPISTTVAIDTDTISIADSINFQLKIKCDSGYTAELPELNNNMFADLIIKDRFTYNTEYYDTYTVLKEQYILMPIVSGNYTIKPVDIEFYSENIDDTKIYTIKTKSLKINVISLSDTNTKIPEFRESVSLMKPEKSYKLFYYILTGIIIFLIIVVSSFYLKSKFNKKIIKTKSLKPHEIAYNKLKKLVHDKLLEKNQIKLFYYRISLILREYIENRYNIKAAEQTTEEFLNHILTTKFFDQNDKNILQKFLMHCDIVKYAKHIPDKKQIENTFNIVKQFIDKTKQEN